MSHQHLKAATVQTCVFILNTDIRHKNDRVAEIKAEAVAMVDFLEEAVRGVLHGHVFLPQRFGFRYAVTGGFLPPPLFCPPADTF